MKRFVTVSRWSYQLDEDCPETLAQTVFEAERRVVDTGLLDASGDRIFSVEEMDQIGFIRRPPTC